MTPDEGGVSREEMQDLERSLRRRSDSGAYDQLLKLPIPRIESLGAHFVFLLLIATLAVLYFGKVNVIVQARGVIRTVEETHRIEALVGGVVKQILAKPGDRLGKGEPVVVLEASETDIRIADLERELEGMDGRLKKNRDAAMAAASILDNVETFLEKGIDGNLAGNMYSLFLELKSAWLKLEKFKAGRRGASSGKDLDLMQAEVNYELALARFRDGHASLDEGVRTLENDIERKKGELALAKESRENAVIRMPFDGVVGAISVSNIGQALEAGAFVAEAYAAGSPMEVLVEVPNKDIGMIASGTPASVKVDAYSYKDFGSISGEVKRVAPNIAGADRFPVLIAMKEQSLRRGGREYRLFPGLTVEADLVTRRIRMFRLIFSDIGAAGDEPAGKGEAGDQG